MPNQQEQKAAYARDAHSVLDQLDVQLETGLDAREVEARREQHGPNELREAETRSAWAILIEQFKSMIVVILTAAGILAFSFGELAEGIAIFAVILVNTAISFVSEWRALRSMEALREMEEDTIRVRREGKESEIPSDQLVPGDLALFEQGDLAPADLRLVEANGVRVNEASLTGESVPVDKQTDPVDQDAPLAERTNMLYRGTTVVEGSGVGVVAATGMDTELGHISEMAEEAEKEATPLQQRLNNLGTRLAWITLAVAALVAVAGLIAGQETVLMIQTAIALGVAAIPEGLPIVATIALASGMWHMARRQALINQLPAVETLGATRIIFTDKTGTLTQNRMMLQKVVTSAGEVDLDEESSRQGESSDADALLRRVLEVCLLCNNATLIDEDNDGQAEEELGDPTEVALLRGATRFGLDREELLQERPEAREVPFHTDTKMMATYHEVDGDFLVAVKGAPGAVLENCSRLAAEDGQDEQTLRDEDRQAWLERGEELAAQGLRLLAVADKRVSSVEAEPYEDLRLLGLVGLADPPAEGVRDSIALCQQAGIRVVMVTGDQPATAKAIARQVGLRNENGDEDLRAVAGQDVGEPDELTDDERRRLLSTPIFARVSPEQKLRLIRLHQAAGEIVAMTGDGVNDAPALKKADIGIAMGKRGTDAAKEVADMILQDDRFASIVAAVEQGRVIFGNIRKSIMFMLCTNIAEVIAVAVASLARLPLPLHPLQILYLNVLTDVFPALALGVGKGPPEVMEQPPRPPDEKVLTRRHWTAIGGWAVLVAGCVLTALLAAWWWLGMEEDLAVTVSFLTLGFAKLWFVFNLRSRGSRLWNNDIVRNPWIWGSIVLCAGLLAVAVYVPGLSDVLHTRNPGWQGWSIVFVLSLFPLLVGQILRAFQHAERPEQDVTSANRPARTPHPQRPHSGPAR